MKEMLISKQKINMIQNALQSKTKFVVIQGPSGSGKTTVIEMIASKLRLKTEYIENIKKFTRFVKRKTIGIVDIDDKMSLLECLQKKYGNKMIIETRCTVTAKELELPNKKEKNIQATHTCKALKNGMSWEMHENDCSPKKLHDAFAQEKILNGNFGNVKADNCNGEIEFLCHKETVMDQNIPDREVLHCTERSNDQNCYYDDLVSSEPEAKKAKSNKLENEKERNFVLITFPKISDAKVKRFTSKVDLVNGNLHKLKMLDLLKQVTFNAEFYHFLGKLLYLKSDDEEKKQEIVKLHRRFEYNKLNGYLRANFIYFASIQLICDFFRLISEIESYNNEQYLTLIKYVCKVQKQNPKKFRGFKSCKIETGFVDLEYIP